MSIRSLLLAITIFISTASLGAGYLLSGYWLAIPAMILVWGVWFFTRGRSVFLSSSGVFIAYIFLSAFGIHLALPRVLMLLGSISALVVYDLLGRQPYVRDGESALHQKYHLRVLGFATFGGIVAVIPALFLNIEFSFGILVGVVILAAASFIVGIQILMR